MPRSFWRLTQVAYWPPLDGDSVGLARGLGSNEKVEMTRFARPGEGRTVLIYGFSPLAVLVTHIE